VDRQSVRVARKDSTAPGLLRRMEADVRVRL